MSPHREHVDRQTLWAGRAGDQPAAIWAKDGPTPDVVILELGEHPGRQLYRLSPEAAETLGIELLEAARWLHRRHAETSRRSPSDATPGGGE